MSQCVLRKQQVLCIVFTQSYLQLAHKEALLVTAEERERFYMAQSDQVSEYQSAVCS